jgi:hypothetical protein
MPPQWISEAPNFRQFYPALSRAIETSRKIFSIYNHEMTYISSYEGAMVVR